MSFAAQAERFKREDEEWKRDLKRFSRGELEARMNSGYGSRTYDILGPYRSAKGKVLEY